MHSVFRSTWIFFYILIISGCHAIKAVPVKKDSLVFTIAKSENHLIEFNFLKASPVVQGELFMISCSFKVKGTTPIDDGIVTLSVIHYGFQLVNLNISLRTLFDRAEFKNKSPAFPLLPGRTYDFEIGNRLPDHITPGLYNVYIDAFTAECQDLFTVNAKFFKSDTISTPTPQTLQSDSSLITKNTKQKQHSQSSGSELSISLMYYIPIFLCSILLSLA